MKEEDLYKQLVQSRTGHAATTGADPVQVPSAEQLRAALARIRQIRQRCGLPEQALGVVAVSRADDLELDGAYVRLIQSHPEVAAQAPDPALFSRLQRFSAALTGMDAAVTPLLLEVAQAAIDLNQPIEAVLDTLEAILARPPRSELAPGVTVRLAQVVLSDMDKRYAAAVQAPQAAREQVLSQEAHQQQQVAAAAQGLQDEHKVQVLTQAARRGALPAVADPPLPKVKARPSRAGTGRGAKTTAKAKPAQAKKTPAQRGRKKA